MKFKKAQQSPTESEMRTQLGFPPAYNHTIVQTNVTNEINQMVDPQTAQKILALNPYISNEISEIARNLQTKLATQPTNVKQVAMQEFKTMLNDIPYTQEHGVNALRMFVSEV